MAVMWTREEQSDEEITLPLPQSQGIRNRKG